MLSSDANGGRIKPPGHRKRAKFTTFHVRKLFQTIGALRLVRVDVVGRENIPKSGRALFVLNHTSFIDILIIWTVLRGTAVAIGAAEMFKIWYIGWIGKLLGYIPYVRKAKDGSNAAESKESGAKAEQMMVDVLNDDGKGIIFSEGYRERKGNALGKFQQGPARIAIKAKAPLYPCYIHGANDFMPHESDRRGLMRLIPINPFKKITLFIGSPLNPSDFTNAENLTEASRNAVLALRDDLLDAA